MQPIYSNTDLITIYRKNFLCASIDDTTPLDVSLFKNKLCIYAIVNLKNNLKYIGKTTNLLNRANNYIWNIRNYNESESSLMRSINKAMVAEGINNFRMIPIDIASNREQLAQLERKYILEYKTYDPSFGYNCMIPSGNDYFQRCPKSIAPYQSIEARKKKAKLVACINIHTKILFISVGMKLFGDMIESSKDYVKNCAKRGGECKGFYIIYLNNADRIAIKEDKQNKLALFNKNREQSIAVWGKPWHFSWNGHAEYLSIVSLIEDMLDDFSTKSFEKMGYHCFFLNYNDELNNPENLKPFDVQNIDNAFQYILSMNDDESLLLE